MSTATTPDTTAPTVTANSPVYNETILGIRPQIRAAFSEPVNPISLTASSFYLYDYWTGAFVRSTITIAADRRSVLLVPDTPLTVSTQYYYALYSFEDLAGNVASLGTIYFRTGAGEDTTAPTVTGLAPPGGARPVVFHGKAISPECLPRPD